MFFGGESLNDQKKALIIATKRRIELTLPRKCARVVDRVALEMRSTGNCTGGSNPSTSAKRTKAPIGSFLLLGGPEEASR